MIRFDGFDWNEGNQDKCLKHGVSIDEIEALFLSDLMVRRDQKHSSNEARFQAVGRTATGRSVFLVFTVRNRRGSVLYTSDKRTLYASEGSGAL